MANHALVNNVAHKDLKVITTKSVSLGDNQMCSVTFPFEFRNVQANYPIVFSKDPNSNAYFPIALFGFEQGENLFLEHDGWHANYIPIMIERGPFLIGFQESVENGVASKNTVVTIDLDNPKVSEVEGESLFLPHGGNTDYLDKIAGMLQAIHDGQEINQAFNEALAKYELLEPFVLDIELNDGSTNRLAGFHTINEEKLAALDADALADLNRNGFLQAIYMAVASLSNLRTLIDKRNSRL